MAATFEGEIGAAGLATETEQRPSLAALYQ
jgi:hypothetical protein